MCLVVKNKWHKDRKPLITEEDIVVFKVLFHNINNKMFTPIRRHGLVFKNGKALLEARISTFTQYTYCTRKPVTVCTYGIHAFLNSQSPYITSWLYHGINLKIHKAIIPKGAEYYIGDEGDIVAEKMIIFEEIYNAKQRLSRL